MGVVSIATEPPYFLAKETSFYGEILGIVWDSLWDISSTTWYWGGSKSGCIPKGCFNISGEWETLTKACCFWTNQHFVLKTLKDYEPDGTCSLRPVRCAKIWNGETLPIRMLGFTWFYLFTCALSIISYSILTTLGWWSLRSRNQYIKYLNRTWNYHTRLTIDGWRTEESILGIDGWIQPRKVGAWWGPRLQCDVYFFSPPFLKDPELLIEFHSSIICWILLVRKIASEFEWIWHISAQLLLNPAWGPSLFRRHFFPVMPRMFLCDFGSCLAAENSK